MNIHDQGIIFQGSDPDWILARMGQRILQAGQYCPRKNKKIHVELEATPGA
jgi:hypothetical protein